MDKKQMDEKQKDEYIAQLESIIAMMPGLVYWKDKNGKFLGCNHNEAKVFGLSLKEFIGKTTTELVGEKLAPALLANDEYVLTTGKEYSVEEIGPDGKGNHAIYLTKKTALKNRQGEIIGLVGISFDVSERKKLEEELKKTQKDLKEAKIHLENILALIPGHVYWKDLQGLYLGCNDAFARTLNLPSRTTIFGKSDSEFIGEELAREISLIDQNVIQNDKAITIEENAIDKNHNPAVYLSQKAPLKNSEGKTIGLVGVSFDITARKKTEEELKRTQERLLTINNEKTKFIESMSYLDNIISLIPGNVYWKDTEGHYLGCNDTFAKIIKLTSREAIINKTDFELIGEKFASSVVAIDNEVIKTNTPKVLEEIGFDIDGNPATYLSRKIPLRNEENKVIGLLGLSFDITERKKFEEELLKAKERAEAANRSKSEFLAMISHELRIPLTGILGIARLMKSNPDASMQEEAEDIVKSGEHLLAIINDLLDITKLEANKVELDLLPVNLKKLIETVTAMLALKAQQNAVVLKINYDKNIPEKIMADAKALRQVFINLVGNAVKFTQQGYIAITVNSIEKNASNIKIKISVKDTGIGIEKEKLETIFERFNQADTSITRKYGGTGLGLAITKAYTTLMGGEISVESTLDIGSIFTCILSFPLPTSSVAIPTKNTSKILKSIATYRNKKHKVLLVEDDAIVAKVHTAMLEKAGYIVERAITGNEAVAMAENDFNLIIMDVGLSDISGYEATRKIRHNQQLNNRFVPIIGLTGYGHEEYKIKGLESGMDVVAIKPIKLTDLEQLLNEHLSK